MSKPLLVAWGHEFVDEVLDALGPDLEMEVVVGKPTVDQWRTAPLVVIDARCRTLANGLPAHPRMEVVAPVALYGERLAEVIRAWRADYPDAAAYALPRAAQGLRESVATAAVSRQAVEVRVGVVGGHGGAGATTLAVAIALAAADEGRRALLVDAVGRGGVNDRLGTASTSLRVVDAPDLPAEAIERTSAEVKVVDLDRALDGSQVDAARLCDVVLLVANVQRNAMASRRVAQRLAGAGVPFAMVPTWTNDRVAQALAEECAVRLLREVPLDPPSVFSDGRVYLVGHCDLLALARELVHHAPSVAARMAA
ncbi:hypothetical protein [Verrucosispora sp. WMMD1129]|uniref:hypothetical protein n=1 Tax=Verrucosispora sp. WMMD1129 TaxID=3016093 RepID=UPI00249B3BAB|nr:hypothetical protein [Verrucosispora sp. WMMD1129]WFE47636.1 hypothetical protein O7624_26585 [Verrucosispora sp. WMMD1129]